MHAVCYLNRSFSMHQQGRFCPRVRHSRQPLSYCISASKKSRSTVTASSSLASHTEKKEKGRKPPPPLPPPPSPLPPPPFSHPPTSYPPSPTTQPHPSRRPHNSIQHLSTPPRNVRTRKRLPPPPRHILEILVVELTLPNSHQKPRLHIVRGQHGLPRPDAVTVLQR